MKIVEALLNLKSAIEEAGGIAELTIQLNDQNTYEIFRSDTSGIFTPTDIVNEYEGLNGIKFWIGD